MISSAYLALLGVSLLTAAAQVLIKKGAGSLDTGGKVYGFFKSLFSKPLLLGLSFTLAAPLLYFYALKTLPLSKAYPFSSLNYLFILLACRFILKERITFYHYLGIILIAAGVLLSNWQF